MFGTYEILYKCKRTNARVSTFELSNGKLELPIYMPVGTYGAMKAVTTDNIKENMILANTYHLRELGKNIKKFMKYNGNMLTDSGGFQIGSLPDVVVEEEGVKFFDKMFTPEESMDIQMVLGADIIMQLDEVVNPNDKLESIEIATKRSIRWLDRCIKQVYYNENTAKRIKTNEEILSIKLSSKSTQILFPIVTGGLSEELRQFSINEILKRNPVGLAIGGLSGGEEKSEFARTVSYCCKNLPENIPRYIMGVGYPEDIVVCVALGTDMSDCVYPTRTARFGRFFSDNGDFIISNRVKHDFTKNDECDCFTCKNYSFAYLNLLKGTSNFCMLATEHNLHYMRNLTKRIREAIKNNSYPEFIKEFMTKRYKKIPEWIVDVMKQFNIQL